MMRCLFLLFGLPMATVGIAQPGWHDLNVVFSLYHQGVLVAPRDLQVSPEFHFIVDGHQVTPHQVAGTDRSVVKFDALRGDPMLHTDTLWLQIVHQQDRMRIAFPPPYRGDTAKPYSTSDLHIDFRSGTFLAYELPLDVRLKGTAENVSRWYPFAPWEGLYLRSGDRYWHSGDLRANPSRIDAEVACIPYFLGDRQWVDLSLEVAPVAYDPIAPRRMTIRAPVQAIVDVKDFDFVNTRMVWNESSLLLERTLPRDTAVMGNTMNTAVIVRPVNPTVHDTLAIEVRWLGAGAPYVSGHRLVAREDGTTEIRFHFALHTDVDLNDMSGPEVAVPFNFTELPPGQYVITQEVGKVEHTADLDVLIGVELPVTITEFRPSTP